MVTGRPSIALKIASKSPRCIGSSLARAASRSFSVVGQNHLAHRDDAVGLEEHMLGAAEGRYLRRRICAPWRRRRGVSALVRTFKVRTASAQPIRVLKSPVSSGWRILTSPFVNLAGGAIDGDDLAAPDRDAAAGHLALGDVDLERARAGNAGPPHAARHNGRMAGHAAARGQNAFCGVHAVNVFRAGFGAHQDHVMV